MSDAITYQHDGEARRGNLVIDTSRLDDNDNQNAWQPWRIDRSGHLMVVLSDDEAITLYELLRAHWAGYVAERDEAAAAVRGGVPLATFLNEWRTDTVDPFLDLHDAILRDDMRRMDGPDESFGAYVDSGAADQARDLERGK